MHRPRTSRQRGGVAFTELRTNAWAAFIGFLLGRGYSSVAIAETLSDGTSSATVRRMSRRWGLKRGVETTALVIPMKARDRANLFARAQQHEITVEEYCRRILIGASMPRDRFDELA